jgi:hypothetical protein
MNMVEFGYFFALALIAMVIAVRGARVLRRPQSNRNDAGQADAALSARYI